MGERILYLLLCPDARLRGAFLGTLFGSFESAPGGQGERAVLPFPGGELLVVGAGAPGRLMAVLERVRSRMGLDGVLLLVPAGDQEGWEEARALRESLLAGGRGIPLRALVMDHDPPPDREMVRSLLLSLLGEQERLLGAER